MLSLALYLKTPGGAVVFITGMENVAWPCSGQAGTWWPKMSRGNATRELLCARIGLLLKANYRQVSSFVHNKHTLENRYKLYRAPVSLS